jgi:hypothetical protein
MVHKLIERCEKGPSPSSCTFVADPDDWGGYDPAKNVPKTFSVTYRCGSQGTDKTETVPDGKPIRLVCP